MDAGTLLEVLPYKLFKKLFPKQKNKQVRESYHCDHLLIHIISVSRGDERQEIAAAPKPVRVPLKPFVEDVWCDTVNNQFIVHLPETHHGELKMGLDLDHAQCGATSVTEQGLIFSYG